MEANPSIAICISTYKRPKALKKLLLSIASLQFSEHSPKIKIVIVDNSSEQEAEEVVCSLQGKMPYEIIYDLEPRKGLSFVRNKTVEVAGDVDLIAFVDDDEVVSPLWLEALLTALDNYEADIVRGPVISKYDSEPPKWIKQGNFYQRPKFKDGQRLANANTGNLLVKTEWLKKISPPFDRRFNLSGAEDSLLFRQLHRRGARIVWAEKAVVEETLTKDRMTKRWILNRSFQLGNTNAFIEKSLGTGRLSIFLQTLKNLIKVVLSVLLLPFSIIFGKTKVIQLLRYVYYGVGYISGRFGYRYLAYQ